MKKLHLLTALFCLTLISFSQENETWRIGVQWGAQGTRSSFAGGMPDANASFYQSKFDARAFSVLARYDLNNHWMATVGLGFNSFGFDYSLANNYSLYHPKTHFTGIHSDFGALELPLMVYYKFNPNCKNAKWLVGAGFSQSFTGARSIASTLQGTNDGVTPANNLNSVSSTNGGMYTMLRMAIARERVFKKGGILNVSLLLNAGLRQLATSTVNYTVDGQNYVHQFTTKGNFMGLRLTYFFRPLKQKTIKTATMQK